MERVEGLEGRPMGFNPVHDGFLAGNAMSGPGGQLRQLPRGVLTAIEEDSVAETDTTAPLTIAHSTALGRTARRQAEHWEQLSNLEQLYKQGYIDERDYNERKKQLIDQLTGTKTQRRGNGATTMRSMTRSSLTRTSVSTSRRRSRRRRRDMGLLPVVVPRAPPDFHDLPYERAVKHIFNYAVRRWEKEDLFVRIDPTPFASGGLRLVYHMQMYETEEEARASGLGRAAETDLARNPSTAGSTDSGQPRIRSLADGDPASTSSARASVDSAESPIVAGPARAAIEGVPRPQRSATGSRPPSHLPAASPGADSASGGEAAGVDPGEDADAARRDVPDVADAGARTPAQSRAAAAEAEAAGVGTEAGPSIGAGSRQHTPASSAPSRGRTRTARTASDGSLEGVDPTSASGGEARVSSGGVPAGAHAIAYASGSGSETAGGEGDRAAVLLGPGDRRVGRAAAVFGAGALPSVRGSHGAGPAPVLARHRASEHAAALAHAAAAAECRRPLPAPAGADAAAVATASARPPALTPAPALAAEAAGSAARPTAAVVGGDGCGDGGAAAAAPAGAGHGLARAGAAGRRAGGDAEAYVPAVTRNLPRAPSARGGPGHGGPRDEAAAGGADGGGGGGGGEAFDPRTGQSGTLVTGIPGRGENGTHSVPGLATIPPGGTWVAKVAMGEGQDVDTYFRDVEMQLHCAAFASSYNSYLPPRTVQFAPCFVLQLVERPGAVFCHAEPHIRGRYQKFNNNAGWVEGDEEAQRNTPQAFSHFTLEASRCRILVVDIQGVGDCYTDPQVHTLNERGFGRGNRGTRGIENFLTTHRCNSICSFLRLAAVNPKSAAQDKGTMPAQPVMASTRINPVKVEQEDAYARTPHLVGFMERAGMQAAAAAQRAAASGRRTEEQPLLASEHVSPNAPYTGGGGGIIDPATGAVVRRGHAPASADKEATRCRCTLL